MIEAFIGLLRRTSSRHSPAQIAWAVALGCACGLLPNSSLLFPASLVLLFFLPVHLPAATICLLLSSCLAWALQPFQEAAGLWLWNHTSIQGVIQRVDQYPIAPWLQLHHAVVLGSLATSISICIPLAWLTNRWMSGWTAVWLVNQRRQETMQTRAQQAAENWSVPHQPTVQPKPALIAPQVEPKPLATSLDHETGNSSFVKTDAISETIDSIHALEDLIERALEDHSAHLDTDAVLARATRAAALVDDILAAIDDDASQAKQENADAPRAQPVQDDNVPQVAKPISHQSHRGPIHSRRTDPSQSLTTTHLAVGDGPVPNDVANNSQEVAVTGYDSLPQSAPQSTTHQASSVGSRRDLPQTFRAFDTKISISRSAAASVKAADIEINSPKSSDSMSISSPIQERPVNPPAEIIAPAPPKKTLGAVAAQNTITKAHETATRNVEIRHEEALRHLLSHLRALKEKV